MNGIDMPEGMIRKIFDVSKATSFTVDAFHSKIELEFGKVYL